MATIIQKNGDNLTGITITANAAGSTATHYVVGPPNNISHNGGQAQARYVLQSGTTFRWVADESIGASASVPTGYTADNL